MKTRHTILTLFLVALASLAAINRYYSTKSHSQDESENSSAQARDMAARLDEYENRVKTLLGDVEARTTLDGRSTKQNKTELVRELSIKPSAEHNLASITRLVSGLRKQQQDAGGADQWHLDVSTRSTDTEVLVRLKITDF